MTTNEHAPSWPVQAACLSDVGRVRRQNEDQCLVALERQLFIVSDGMGGHQAGKVASRAVVTVLPPMIEQRAAWTRTLPSTEAMELVLRDALVELSQRLRAESVGRAGLQGMGATVAVAWLRGSVAHLAHMGDSRIYLFREARLIQLTEDHSVVGLLLRHGEITSEDAQTHPARGRLSRYVGMEEAVYPDVQTLHLQRGDRLLLCSDGLTNMVPDRQIMQIVQGNAEAEAACRELINAANTAGGSDNITALVVDCGKEEASRGKAREADIRKQNRIAP